MSVLLILLLVTAVVSFVGLVAGAVLAAVLAGGHLSHRTFGWVLAASLVPIAGHCWNTVSFANSYGIGDMAFGFYPALRQFAWLVPSCGVLLLACFWLVARRAPLVAVLLPAVSFVLYVTIALPWLMSSPEAVVLDNRAVTFLFVLSSACCTGLFGFLLMTLGWRDLLKPWPITPPPPPASG